MSIEGASAPLLIPGTEVVNFTRTLDPTYTCDTAISGLRTFAHNSGSIRIKSDIQHIPLAIMYSAPAHFSNFPRTVARDYQPYDVIVSPETKLGAHEMAQYLAGQQLNNTRYIFPNDGVVLQETGFTSELELNEVIAHAIEHTSKIPHYELFHTPKATGIRRWIGQKTIQSLNKAIGDIPQAEKAPPPQAEKQLVRKRRSQQQLQEFARIAVSIQQIQNPKIISYSEQHASREYMNSSLWENNSRHRINWYNE